ncbi:MAG: hypothetical protein PHX08_14010 [Lachnospiraceae bacterium]|nr:hypothetical protein [Lachnospiraceae bacterium]
MKNKKSTSFNSVMSILGGIIFLLWMFCTPEQVGSIPRVTVIILWVILSKVIGAIVDAMKTEYDIV